MAAARGDEAGRRQKTFSRQQIPARRRVEREWPFVSCFVTRFQFTALHVAQNFRPELHAVADGNRIGVRSDFVGARLRVQPAKNNFAPLGAIPARQFVGTFGKR